MYVEKNGYLVMKTEEMSFLDREGTFSDDIEDAEIFEDLSVAKTNVNELNEEYGNLYEIVAYHKTIWIDKMGLVNEKTNVSTCCDGDCCCASNDIDDFGIPASVLDEVAEEKAKEYELVESLTLNRNGEEVNE